MYSKRNEIINRFIKKMNAMSEQEVNELWEKVREDHKPISKEVLDFAKKFESKANRS